MICKVEGSGLTANHEDGWCITHFARFVWEKFGKRILVSDMESAAVMRQTVADYEREQYYPITWDYRRDQLNPLDYANYTDYHRSTGND